MKEFTLRSRPTLKQEIAFYCPAEEILYGGALGGGKSWLAVMKAYEIGVNNSGLRIGVFRRSLQELENTIVKEALENYVPKTYKYVPTKRRFELPNGTKLLLGFIETDKDLTQYQGQEFDVLLIDEATNFTEYQLIYLKSRLRSSKGFRTRIYYMTNPTGVGKGYLKRRFIDGRLPYKLYKTPETKNIPLEGELRNGIWVFPKHTCYIPSKLHDNKHLMEKDPLYIDSLNELPEEIRKALLDGDWDSKVGTYFPQWDKKIHVVENYEPAQEDQLFLSCDWGTNKPFAIYWYAIQPNGHCIMYREYYGCVAGTVDTGLDLTSRQVADQIIRRSPEEEQYRYMVLDSACWSRDGQGGSVYEEMQKILQKRKISIIQSKKGRINGFSNIKNWLSIDEETSTPYLTITKKCYNFIRTIPDLVYSSTKEGDMDDRQENHPIESLSYFLMSRPRPKEPIVENGFNRNQWGLYLEEHMPELLEE